MAQHHKNFAYSTVATAPSPANSGTSLVVAEGQGGLFPEVPFSATVWPTATQPSSSNAEIVTVTAVSGDTLTITRAQESTSARSIIVGDQIAATVTASILSDIETIASTYVPYIMASAGTGVQTLASTSNQTGTGSLFLFPVTVPANLQFNQVLVPNSFSYVTTAIAAASNTYSSKFGIYSRNANTLSLISSNSFSIGETVNSVSLTWNYPTTTATSGYGYGSFPSGNLTATTQMQLYISSMRVVGLHFGGNLSLNPGVYWLGLMSQRSAGDSRSTHGFSNAGIIGNIMNGWNSLGSVSGPLPLGVAASDWGNINSNVTGWWGRHVAGFVTATSITNQLGTAIPAAVTLSALGAVANASTVSILPAVTFVST